MGGGGGAQTTSEVKLPSWSAEPAARYLSDAFTLSREAYTSYRGWRYNYEETDNGQRHFESNFPDGVEDVVGATYAQMNRNEVNGIMALINRASMGDTAVKKAYDLVRAVTGGTRVFLNTKADDLFNQKIDDLLQEFNEITVPAIDQNAIIGKYYGGSGHNAMLYRAASLLMRQVREILDDVYYRDYASAVAEIPRLMENALSLGQEDVRNMELLRLAGLYMREFAQGAYSDTYKAFLDAEDINVKKLNILGNAVKTLAGSASSSTVPTFRPNSFAEVAGIATAGTAIAMSMFKGTSRAEKISEFSQQNIPAAGPNYIENFGNSNPGSPMMNVENFVEQRGV